MLSITELSRDRFNELRRTITTSDKNTKKLRSLMLDLLAKAYESESYIAPRYFDRANDLLSISTNRLITKALKDKIKSK